MAKVGPFTEASRYLPQFDGFISWAWDYIVTLGGEDDLRYVMIMTEQSLEA